MKSLLPATGLLALLCLTMTTSVSAATVGVHEYSGKTCSGSPTTHYFTTGTCTTNPIAGVASTTEKSTWGALTATTFIETYGLFTSSSCSATGQAFYIPCGVCYKMPKADQTAIGLTGQYNKFTCPTGGTYTAAMGCSDSSCSSCDQTGLALKAKECSTMQNGQYIYFNDHSSFQASEVSIYGSTSCSTATDSTAVPCDKCSELSDGSSLKVDCSTTLTPVPAVTPAPDTPAPPTPVPTPAPPTPAPTPEPPTPAPPTPVPTPAPDTPAPPTPVPTPQPPTPEPTPAPAGSVVLSTYTDGVCNGTETIHSFTPDTCTAGSISSITTDKVKFAALADAQFVKTYELLTSNCSDKSTTTATYVPCGQCHKMPSATKTALGLISQYQYYDCSNTSKVVLRTGCTSSCSASLCDHTDVALEAGVCTTTAPFATKAIHFDSVSNMSSSTMTTHLICSSTTVWSTLTWRCDECYAQTDGTSAKVSCTVPTAAPATSSSASSAAGTPAPGSASAGSTPAPGSANAGSTPAPGSTSASAAVSIGGTGTGTSGSVADSGVAAPTQAAIALVAAGALALLTLQ